MTLRETLQAIRCADRHFYDEAQGRWNSIAKPLGGLGMLEDAVCRLAAAQANSEVNIDKRVLVVFCADNGVVSEGVTQSESEITTIVAQNLCANSTSACRMAESTGCDVVTVDVGMYGDLNEERLIRRKVAYGTGNIAKESAMSREQLEAALEVGIKCARDLSEQGYSLLAAGEMGIGNTTTSSAVASVLLGRDPGEMTGRGAGLSSEGLERKVAVVKRAIAVNQPDATDPLDVVQKVGGFDIAALCGFYLGAAEVGCPVILDGFISGVAALCATRLNPAVSGYMLASHQSAEPAAHIVLSALDIGAPIHADMHLGEGTGAVALMPLLDMALAVYSQSRTFEDSAMQPYEQLS